MKKYYEVQVTEFVEDPAAKTAIGRLAQLPRFKSNVVISTTLNKSPILAIAQIIDEEGAQ